MSDAEFTLGLFDNTALSSWSHHPLQTVSDPYEADEDDADDTDDADEDGDMPPPAPLSSRAAAISTSPATVRLREAGPRGRRAT